MRISEDDSPKMELLLDRWQYALCEAFQVKFQSKLGGAIMVRTCRSKARQCVA